MDVILGGWPSATRKNRRRIVLDRRGEASLSVVVCVASVIPLPWTRQLTNLTEIWTLEASMSTSSSTSLRKAPKYPAEYVFEQDGRFRIGG